MINGADVVWKKSRRSGSASDNCVEVARFNDGSIAIRDSKDRSGPVLRFSTTAWRQFLDDLRAPEMGK
jgi:hypothetical protein